MAILSRPVLYGSIGVIAIAAFWLTGDDPKTKTRKISPRTPAKRSALQSWAFPEEETSLRFGKPAVKARNVFHPLIESQEPGEGFSEEEIVKLPADLADGESDWAYTGMVEVDGRKLALLENASRHLGGYVREGETWKKSRIISITMSNIVLEGPDGAQKTVGRYNPNQPPKPQPVPEGGFRPLDVSPALRGTIGPDLRLRPNAGGAIPGESSPSAGSPGKMSEVPVFKSGGGEIKADSAPASPQKEKLP